MPGDDKQAKAKKLAAARKKLKEYQNRSGDSNCGIATDVALAEQISQPASPMQSSQTESISSNISERSDSEFNMIGVGESKSATPTVQNSGDMTSAGSDGPLATAASYFSSNPRDAADSESIFNTQIDAHNNLNTIQVLISEKSQLTTELNKYRAMCREKDLELEELHMELNSNTERRENMQASFLAKKQTAEEFRNANADLKYKLAQKEAEHADMQAHMEELQKEFASAQVRATEFEKELKEKCNELEMAQIRIRQLSDETNISKDNRIETLTQTQFMYEQQIRDLQAIVQQLSQDKEQASAQYQNYVQHLNTEVNNLNGKNGELMDECAKLQERERVLVDHISELERDIQKNLSRQDQLKAEKTEQLTSDSTTLAQIEELKEKLSDIELERHEFQLKIKSQEDRLEEMTAMLQHRESELLDLTERLERADEAQPDQVKLLATMESDKVAASRALTQNVELKKQLDELEMRFVQLTNDKAELMNKLDAEEFANREIRTNFVTLQEQIKNFDERFRFKDEEMIRLSHESMELISKNSLLQQQLDALQCKKAEEQSDTTADIGAEYKNDQGGTHVEDQLENHNHAHHHHHDQGQCDGQHKHFYNHEMPQDIESNGHEHAHSSEHSGSCHIEELDCIKDCAETTYAERLNLTPSSPVQHKDGSSATIAPPEAVEKLQERFTRLMSQMADLIDEKQRLEHLVLQLQGETETIGEYITLYQTQRRMLKQREYEKASQMQLLQAEREQLHEKIAILNKLVSSLNAETAQFQLKTHPNAVTQHDGHSSVEPCTIAQEIVNDRDVENQTQQTSEYLNNGAVQSPEEPQKIIHRIQNILTEIKENSKEVPNSMPSSHTEDHLNCCLGKFEIV